MSHLSCEKTLKQINSVVIKAVRNELSIRTSRNPFIAVRIPKYWHRLSQEVVEFLPWRYSKAVWT